MGNQTSIHAGRHHYSKTLEYFSKGLIEAVDGSPPNYKGEVGA